MNVKRFWRLGSEPILCGVAFAVLWAAPLASRAETVWSGPLLIYSQPSPDPTQATNQDRMTPDVWLTRATSKGLFNAFYETNATALSPTNTEWAFGALTNYAALNYTNWLAMLNGASPVTLVGQPLVVHLLADDIYLSLQFSFWAAGGSGGFAYQRSTPAPALLSGAKVSGGQFSFNYSTAAGYSYIIESSTNLVNWTSLTTNVAAGSSTNFSTAWVAAVPQFFRVGRLANP